MSHVNDVTLFSNGMGHFRRTYDVKEKTLISIPFKKDHIGDVAASLQVFGDVKLNSPPTFTPSNSNDTALRIQSGNALKSLLQSLSGAQVRVPVNGTSKVKDTYTLVGIENEGQFKDDALYTDRLVAILMKDGSVSRRPMDSMTDIEFTEDSVKAEIEKALKNNFQTIKPDSTLVEVLLSPKSGDAAQAIVEYTLPVAAWKMRYTIRQEGKLFTIEGAAIIDNNTDEDWNNFRVSVVTGNPISFATDIANVVVPQRKFVELVEKNTLGNVQAEQGTMVMACSASAGGAEYGQQDLRNSKARRLNVARSLGVKGSVSNYADFGMEACNESQEYEMALAEAPGMTSEEVGDFCVFRSKDTISILSRKSAVVPMFSQKLEQSGLVLLYKESNHDRRPYRAVKFRNETDNTLGRGKTLIYNQSIFSGECVLETTKPGENRMLAHCLENGVKIAKEVKAREQKVSSLKISEGVGVSEQVSTCSTEYVLENKKDEAFKMAFEHTSALGVKDSLVVFDGVEIVEQEKLSDGWRLYFNIAPKQKLTLKAMETRVDRNEIYMHNMHWITTAIIDTKNPLATNPQILECIDLQKQIDKLTKEERDINDKTNKLVSKAQRIRENVTAAKGVEGSSDRLSSWLANLDDFEKDIVTMESRVPVLQEKKQEVSKQLMSKLRDLTVSWKDEPKKVVEKKK